MIDGCGAGYIFSSFCKSRGERFVCHWTSIQACHFPTADPVPGVAAGYRHTNRQLQSLQIGPQTLTDNHTILSDHDMAWPVILASTFVPAEPQVLTTWAVNLLALSKEKHSDHPP